MASMSSRTRLAALASVSALALVGLSGCGSEGKDPVSSDATPTQAADPSDTADEPTEEPSEAAETTTVPVYFVGDTPQGQRLYREFRKVEADNPAAEALALMTAGDALDPDYGTLFPSGSFTSVDIGADKITVGLPDESWTQPQDGMSDDEARLATQQAVYTLQGIAQKRLPLAFTLDGAPADLFGLAG